MLITQTGDGIVKSMLLLLLLLISTQADLRKRAHEQFIAGEYRSALELYDSLATDSSEQRIQALQMIGSIYDEYLGEIDSSITIYKTLIAETDNHRLRSRIKKRITKLESYGDQKEAVGAYQRILISRIPADEKTAELEQLLTAHPDFIKQEEVLRLLSPLYQDQEEYRKAWNTMQRRIALGTAVDSVARERTERYARRETAHTIYIVLLVALGIALIFLSTKNFPTIIKRAAPLLLSWSVVILLFTVVNLIWIQDGLYNPFHWYTPIVILLFNALPILWIVTISERAQRLTTLIFAGFLPASCAFFMMFQIFLYTRDNAMDLMDAFLDRQQELIHGDIYFEGDDNGED